MLGKLQDYYGASNDEAEMYINGRLSDCKHGDEDKIFTKIKSAWSRSKGFPPKEVIAKAFNDVLQKHQNYYWKVCNDCGCEYSYKMPICPDCYKNGFESRAYTVKVSAEKPNVNVAVFNKPYLTPIYDTDKIMCYDCKEVRMSFCYRFGDPEYYCRDLEQCRCKQCCIAHKKSNGKQLEIQKAKLEAMALKKKPINKIIS